MSSEAWNFISCLNRRYHFVPFQTWWSRILSEKCDNWLIDCILLEVFAPSFNKKDFDLGIKAQTVSVMTYWGKFIIEAMQACSILLAAEGLNRSRNRSVPLPVLDVKGIKRMLHWCYTYQLCLLAVFPAAFVESFSAVGNPKDRSWTTSWQLC